MAQVGRRAVYYLGDLAHDVALFTRHAANMPRLMTAEVFALLRITRRHVCVYLALILEGLREEC